MSETMMRGFPAPPEQQVTLANWRTAPFSQWAFQHVREIVPTASIPCSVQGLWTLESDKIDLMDLRVADDNKVTHRLSSVLEQTQTDALLVLHRGTIVTELYRNGMTRRSPHILFSVSKSVSAILCGILIGEGLLDPEKEIGHTLPEARDSVYGRAKLRHLLDMSLPVDFDEDYLATHGAMLAYRAASAWNPLEPGMEASDLRSFLLTLQGKADPPGKVFQYCSPNSDLLGWLLERASGTRFSDLMSEKLWQPLGAAAEASVTLDRLGAPRSAGGISTTARDLARLGQCILQEGQRDGRQVIPKAFLDDLFSKGDEAAWKAGNLSETIPELPIRYRSKWYVVGDDGSAAYGLGIHGQYLYVDRQREVVVVKFSSQPEPLYDPKDRLSIRAFRAIAKVLAN